MARQLRTVLRFLKNVLIVAVMLFTTLSLNGGYLLLSALHFDTLADVLHASRAQAAAQTLYLTTVNATSPYPTTADTYGAIAGVSSDVTTFARNKKTAGFFQFRPGITNTAALGTTAAALPIVATNYGNVYIDTTFDGMQTDAGTWTINFKYSVVYTKAPTVKNVWYRVSKVTCSGGACTNISNISPTDASAPAGSGWSKYAIGVLPASNVLSSAQAITFNGVQTAFAAGEKLYVEYVIETNTTGSNSGGWKFEEGTSSDSIVTANVSSQPNLLTIGATAGAMVAAANSGDASQYANAALCTGSANCAAFTLSIGNMPVTVDSIIITQSGTVNASADLSNVALFYDTDGNYSNGIIGQYGSTVANFTANATTFVGSLVLAPGTTYYLYVRYDAKNGSNAPKGGQTVDFSIASTADVTVTGTAVVSGTPSLAGSTMIVPNATATTYGSGLSDGGRSYDSITISGFGFGTVPSGSHANCSGSVDTGCVRFIVGGNATVAESDITFWSNTSITYIINPDLASFGGSAAVEVVAGGQGDATDLTFHIYPNVTGMAVCAGCGTNAAREYVASDTDGLIMLQGDHLGAAPGTVAFTGGFGNIAGAVHTTGEGHCAAGGWSAGGYANNSVCVEVPASIGNDVYTGTVTVTRSGDTRIDAIDLRILPRIVSNTPTSGVKGDVVQVLGNHFCETGACPGPGVRSTVSDHVMFGATQAIEGGFVSSGGGAGACDGSGSAWTHTEICVKVPVGSGIGNQPTQVTSNNAYVSNTRPFTVLSTIPLNPVNLNQYQSDGVTAVSLGQFATSGSMVYAADLSATLPIDMALQIEAKPVGTAFVCGAGDCTDAVEGVLAGGGACTGCTTLNNAHVSYTHPDGSYHWQARVRNTTTNEYSSWVSFGGNPEASSDYIRDTAAPLITSGPGAVADANSAMITWGTSGEQSTSQVQYNTTGSFVTGCAVNNDCTALDATYGFNHSVTLGGLNSNTTYYYRARSRDAAGNETISPVFSFSTIVVTQPGKTVSFHIIGRTAAISGGGNASPAFSVPLSEISPNIKSAFVELSGIAGSSGTNTVQIQVNSQAIASFVIDASARTHFKVLYPVDPVNVYLNDTPTVNTLSISPSLDMYVSSARIVVTYAYTP